MYEVLIRPDAKDFLPSSLPPVFKMALRAAFDSLKENPVSASRSPPCPPFAPGGRLHEFHVDINDSRYYFRIFFEIDEERKAVGVTHLAIQPRYEPE